MALGRSSFFSLSRILIISLISMIIIQTFILSLACCRTTSIKFIDLFFTSVSVSCVAGTTTIPLESFTRLGHIVMLLCMQIGGLGIITLTFFLISFFLNLNFASQLIAGQLLDIDSWKNSRGMISFFISSALVIELIGALALLPTIPSHYTFFDRIFLSLFHSISAFCHAGFSLFPSGLESQMHNFPMLIILIFLMVIGSLGFPVLSELLQDTFQWKNKKRFSFSLHTKLVLVITALSIGICSFLFIFLEFHQTLAHESLASKVINSLFTIVSARGIGLNTLPTGALQQATLLIIMFLAFIGSSPGSPGSGIKTTTFAVFCATVRATLGDSQEVLLYGRKISEDQIKRASAIIALTIGFIFLIFLTLLIVEHDKSFLDLLFETVSSFGTLGLSTGITPLLSALGKIIIMLTMIIGRIGALLFVLALLPAPTRKEFSYPQERVMIG